MIKSIGTNDPLKESLVFTFDLNLLQIFNYFICQFVLANDIVIDTDSTVTVIFQG